jgi:hypothetical protein
MVDFAETLSALSYRVGAPYLRVGVRWGLGFRKGLEQHYPDVRGTERPRR